jgi:VacB/RNase II family 3'-5' exoribonuclease
MNDRPNGPIPTSQHRALLQRLARCAMTERGLESDFSPAAMAELGDSSGPAGVDGGSTQLTAGNVRDLRGLPWCSIDNDDSRDLDQLNVAEARPDGTTRLFVAIADVSGLVRQRGAIDDHAQQNTTSVYTAGQIFPMLPERLSTDLTSLNFESDRRAIVVEMAFDDDCTPVGAEIYEALVRNRAKLAYNSTAAWLDGEGPMPPAVAAVPGLDENLRLQLRAARRLKTLRHTRGALDLETVRARPVFAGESIARLDAERRNCAKDLIADLMIAANGAVARFLAEKKFPSLRRVVRMPKHWDRIMELAAARGTALPREPDAAALEKFLEAARRADPLRFPDLSLSVIKLMGSGEYVVETPGGHAPGHFGLAVRDYSHSTAPNRRFPDLITQRLLKAALAGRRPPYGGAELEGLALHCTEQEDNAKKVERQIGKSAAALLLAGRIGELFDAIVTGVTDRGTWVRVPRPPVEGKLSGGSPRLKVGDSLRVRLIRTDVERGFIDFAAE